MIEIILLEIISIISFIYSILLIFMPFANIKSIFLVFIWTIISSIIFALNYKKGLIQKFTIVLLFMPLIIYNNPLSLSFIIISNILIVDYIIKSLLKGNHKKYSNTLKICYNIYFFMFILAIIYDGFSRISIYGIPFIIIYLLTSTILLRTIRHLDSGMSLKDIKAINMKYLITITIVSFFVTMEKFRNFIFSSLIRIYRSIINILIKILYYPISFISNQLSKIVMKRPPNLDSKGLEFNMDGNDLNKRDFELVIKDLSFLKFILNIVIILLIVYIVYRIIKKIDRRQYETSEYKEEREFIRRDKRDRTWKWKKEKEKYPKEINNQIRYFYRKYLEFLKVKKVELVDTDTSLEVNKKALNTFSKFKNDEIRKIYIKSRYSNKESTKEDLEKIKNLSNHN